MSRSGHTVDPVRVAKARIATGLKQAEAADALGVNRVTLNKIENGRAKVSLDLLERMTALYGRSREHLSGEDEEPDPVEAASLKVAAALSKISEGFDDLNEVLTGRVREAREVMEVISE